MYCIHWGTKLILKGYMLNRRGIKPLTANRGQKEDSMNT